MESSTFLYSHWFSRKSAFDQIMENYIKLHKSPPYFCAFTGDEEYFGYVSLKSQKSTSSK